MSWEVKTAVLFQCSLKKHVTSNSLSLCFHSLYTPWYGHRSCMSAQLIFMVFFFKANHIYKNAHRNKTHFYCTSQEHHSVVNEKGFERYPATLIVKKLFGDLLKRILSYKHGNVVPYYYLTDKQKWHSKLNLHKSLSRMERDEFLMERLSFLSYELFQNTTYKRKVQKSEWSWLNLLTLVNNSTFWEKTMEEIY